MNRPTIDEIVEAHEKLIKLGDKNPGKFIAYNVDTKEIYIGTKKEFTKLYGK